MSSKRLGSLEGFPKEAAFTLGRWAEQAEWWKAKREDGFQPVVR